MVGQWEFTDYNKRTILVRGVDGGEGHGGTGMYGNVETSILSVQFPMNLMHFFKKKVNLKVKKYKKSLMQLMSANLVHF
jgi:hypothetical protein